MHSRFFYRLQFVVYNKEPFSERLIGYCDVGLICDTLKNYFINRTFQNRYMKLSIETHKGMIKNKINHFSKDPLLFESEDVFNDIALCFESE